jgi:autophagy-related protein 2
LLAIDLSDLSAAMDEDAFRRMPDLGPAPDMIHDDLPTNLDYLDASFGAAAGLRELRDDDLFDFEPHEPEFSRNSLTAPLAAPGVDGVISNVGGETIRMLVSEGIHIVEGHFDTIPQETTDMSSKYDLHYSLYHSLTFSTLFRSGDTNLSVRVKNCDLTVLLYEGYDWLRTRKTIEQEVKAIRRRLVKIRQLLASGQTPDDSIEETSSILFNSVSIGLPHDPEELEPAALIAAIDEELSDGAASESASQSSWQSFKPRHQDGARRPTRLRGRRLERSRNSQIDFRLSGVKFEADRFYPKAPLVSRILLTIKDLEILDHIKTSTWKKFLTELRTDFRGNVRETASDMVRAELRIVHPVPDLSTEEGRLRVSMSSRTPLPSCF